MKLLNEKLLKKIVQRVSDELEGDWIVIGGTVLPLLGVDYRVTIDVDMISFSGASNQSQLDLMTIASEIDLPVETINQAGGFFLQKINNWQKQTILLRKGKKGSVYLPNLELYFKLKLGRLSNSDLQDCIEYYKWSKKNKKAIPVKLVNLVEGELKKKSSKEKTLRLEQLLKAIKLAPMIGDEK